MGIERQPLRSKIREELLRRLNDGTYRGGEGINEVEMANALGVSRTPLREALIGLEFEGQIESQVGKGFRFAHLSRRELAELAPIIAALECLAIDLSDPDELVALAPQLRERARAYQPRKVERASMLHHDQAWHELLLSVCGNQSLVERIGRLKMTRYRCNFTAPDIDAMAQQSAAEHLAVAEHLAAGDLVAAKQALTANWIGGVGRILAGLPEDPEN